MNLSQNKILILNREKNKVDYWMIKNNNRFKIILKEIKTEEWKKVFQLTVGLELGVMLKIIKYIKAINLQIIKYHNLSQWSKNKEIIDHLRKKGQDKKYLDN